jgi:predicted RNA-binding protein
MWRSFLCWEVGKMCEAKVYFSEDGEEQKVMEDVVLMQPEGDAYLLVSLLGEQKLVQGCIERIDFLKHTVHLGLRQETSVEQD